MVCLLVLLVAVAAAMPVAADEVEDLLSRSRFDPARRGEVRSLFDEAAAQGVPAALLLPRLEEGLAKRVPVGRLLGAIQREIGFLLAAREILSEGAEGLLKNEASWARTANLLAGGLPAAEIRALVRLAASRPRDYRDATYLYMALVKWGLPVEETRLLLEALLASALRGEDFGGIVELLIQGRSARIPPERLVERIREALPGVRNLDELKESVLY